MQLHRMEHLPITPPPVRKVINFFYSASKNIAPQFLYLEMVGGSLNAPLNI